MIIYKALNKITGKCYIGQTVKSLHHRKGQHYRQCKYSESHIARALRKYRKEDWEWTILDFAESEKELNEKEKLYINIYLSNVSELGYNSTDGGEGVPGRNMSIETRAKISKKRKGMKFSSDHINNMRICRLGKKLSEETKKKLSTLRMGNKYNLGKKHTQEWKDNMSIIMKKRGFPAGALEKGRMLSRKKVIHIETGFVYDSIRCASKQLKMTEETIINHCKGRTRKQRFKYLDIDAGKVPDICNTNIGHKP